MDWFKKEWIYGTDLPKYRFDYSLKPAADGKVRMTARLTESDVAPDFKCACRFTSILTVGRYVRARFR